ncbi:MAG: SdiA-regulated domain-containing protein [Bacteroidetes bacterium]|nr:SdiA-regulated domain-containing protein [Bacteroidota bacterium]
MPVSIYPTDTNSKGIIKPFNFRPSSLAVHPVTDEIYIISAADFMLVVMDRKGSVLHMKQLDRKLFPKAEGITFLNDGTMIITSEAAGNFPYLNIFSYQ